MTDKLLPSKNFHRFSLAVEENFILLHVRSRHFSSSAVEHKYLQTINPWEVSTEISSSVNFSSLASEEECDNREFPSTACARVQFRFQPSRELMMIRSKLAPIYLLNFRMMVTTLTEDQVQDEEFWIQFFLFLLRRWDRRSLSDFPIFSIHFSRVISWHTLVIEQVWKSVIQCNQLSSAGN